MKQSEKEFESLLSRLAECPGAHARFVNTLSLLEYMGARKIFKSQRAETFSLQVLAHAAEEIRHAQLLKKVALKMSSGVLDSYREEHLHCGAAARRYFQTLDHLPDLDSQGLDEAQRYGLTTLLVEERAVRIYPLYEPILAACGHSGILKAILKDEDKHLLEIRRNPATGAFLSEAFLDQARASEEEAFQQWMSAAIVS